MKKFVKFFALLLSMVILLSSFMVFASNVNSQSPLMTLRLAVACGKSGGTTTSTNLDFSQTKYNATGGGYFLYTDVVNNSVNDINDPVFTNKFEQLKRGDKQRLLENIFKIANAMAYETDHSGMTDESSVTDDTVNDFLVLIQDESGMGSQMLAMLLQNTKPNFVAANRIYEPFSGGVGTVLGFLSIAIMALLGLTMALDIAYIALPAFQLACGGADGNSGGDGKSGGGVGGWISKEAKNAVQQNSNDGQGSKKSAMWTYFKSRIGMLVALGICLLYLVQGQIFAGVAAIIDLFSGFLGF